MPPAHKVAGWQAIGLRWGLGYGWASKPPSPAHPQSTTPQNGTLAAHCFNLCNPHMGLAPSNGGKVIAKGLGVAGVCKVGVKIPLNKTCKKPTHYYPVMWVGITTRQ